MEVMELLLHFLFHFLLLLLLLSSSSSSSSSIHPSTLDPKQLTALQSMGLPVGADPCSPSRNSTTTCDSSAPFRHLVSLSLADCSPELDVSSTALRSLSTLVSLSLSGCPDLPLARHPLPLPLASSLRSFSCSHSLKRLPGVWLSRLRNLTTLSVLSVPVSAASGPVVFLSQMPHLLSAAVSSANLSGRVPHHWHSLNLSRLDLSNNSLSGSLPASLGALSNLQLLNLSSNSLSGPLPDSLADLIYLQSLSLSRNSLSGPVPDAMSALPQLARLDLGSNRLNGSVPRFLADMPGLVYLNLENNDFRGVIPFNASFVKRMEVFRIGGNTNLCYNKSLISPKAAAAAKLGIAACDRHGMPLSPPPDRSSRDSGYSDGGEDEDGDGDGGGGGGGKGGRSAGGGDGGHHGPSTLVLGVGIALACLVFLVIFVVCLSKICG